MNKELNFYKQPFRLKQHGTWVYDADNNFVFQFERKYDEKGDYIPSVMDMEKRVIQSINEDSHYPIESLNLSINGGYILNNGEPFILIRGWGNLTGIGGHNLSDEVAAKIQDEFQKWLIYKLSK